MSSFSKAARGSDGNVGIVTALMLTAMGGLSALAVDYSIALATKAELLSAAEAAAIAGAKALSDSTDVDNAAVASAAGNMAPTKYGNIVVAGDVDLGSYDSNSDVFSLGATPSTAVRVIARRAAANGNAMPTLFGKVLGIDSLDISVTAIASAVSGEPSCITALSNSAPKALLLDSNADVDLTGCRVTVNSTANDALYTASNSNLAADAICVAGQHEQKSNSTISPVAQEGCPAIADPYASLPAPPTTGCDFTNKEVNSNQTATLNPGKYCGGLQIKSNSTVTFNPGVYVIKDAAFNVDSNSQVSGSGVMFYFANGSSLDIDSNATVTFSAPTSGTYSGILFYQASTNTNLASFNSNSVNNLTGALYFPKAKVEFDSNTQMTSVGTCTQIVAWEIEFNSNAGIDMDFDLSTCPSGVQAGGSTEITLVR